MASHNGGSDTGTPVNINKIVINSALKMMPDRINITHMNVGSLFSKIDVIRDTFMNSNVHIVMFSETWLKSNHSDKSVEIPGYYILRADRKRRQGGGVAVFVRNGMVARLVSRSDNGGTEYIFVEVILPLGKILIATVYKAPRVDEILEFGEVVGSLTDRFDDIIILGDLNEDMSKIVNGVCTKCATGNCTVCRLSLVLSDFGLDSVGNEPTHFTNGLRPTQIDLCLTNKLENVLCFGQLNTSYFQRSNHDILFVSYGCHMGNIVEASDYYYRDYNSFSMDDLMQKTVELNWREIFSLGSADAMVNVFNNNVSSLFEEFIPLKRSSRRNINDVNAWFHDGIRVALNGRDIAFRNWKRNGSEVSRSYYCHLRNRATQLIKAAKRRYFNNKLGRGLGSKKLWSNLKNIGIVSSSKVKPEFNSNEYNTYLESLNSSLIGVVSNDNHGFLVNDTINESENLFYFSNVSGVDVVEAFSQVKSGAVGMDGIHLRFIKLLLNFLLPYITHIFNFCLTTSTFPEHWKNAKVFPVHKGSRSRGVQDFRPISILPCLSKVFEKLIKCQITTFLENNHLLCKYQSGFRPGHSTTSAMLKVINDIRSGIDTGYVSILLLLDFKKAFDSVNHLKLLIKLRDKFNFSNSAVLFIKNYLATRFRCVEINEVQTEPCVVDVGVPQGSVLGPLLFSMFINDLPTVLNSCSYHLFADDFQMYHIFDPQNISEAVVDINNDLRAVSQWSDINFLRLNPGKSQVLAIGARLIELPELFLGDDILCYATNVTGLGLTLNGALNWRDHISRSVGKIFASLRSLWPHCRNTPRETRCMLVKSLIIPIFTYCAPVFCGGLDTVCRRVLTKAFNACIRYVFGLDRQDGTTGYVDRLLGCDIFNYYDYISCCFLHGLILSGKPTYLCELICQTQSSRTLNMRLPRHSSSQYNRSFFVHGVRCWNSLPVNLKRINTRKAFGTNCLKYYDSREIESE